MKVALIDLKESRMGCNNKEVAGGFGNAMRGEGFASRIFEWFKRNKLKVPVMHLGYLSAIFRKHGHQVNYYESNPGNEELVIMPSSLVGYDEETAFVREIKKKHPGRKVGFFGAFANTNPEIFLEGGADFIIKGEPEEAAGRIASGDIAPSGIIESVMLTDLESLPNPDWRGFPVYRYSYYPSLKKAPTLAVLTSRGCSFDCHYCPYMVVQTPKFRSRSAGHIVDEIEKLQRDFKVRSLVFRDIIFSINKKRAHEIADEIIKRKIKIEWACETRTDCTDAELLDHLYAAGLRAIHFGIESPVEEVLLKSGRKPIKESHQEAVIRHAQKLGIHVLGFFILGFVEDTRATMQRTIDYAKYLNPSLAQFDLMTPYPGTKFWDQIEPRITTKDWKKYTTYEPVVKLDHLTNEDLLEFKQKAYREFYFRPSWFLTHGKKVIFG